MNVDIHFHTKQGLVWKALKENRFVVLVAGRRFGKTVLAINTLVIEALSHKNGLYWYVAPYRSQAKDIAWVLLKNVCNKLPDEWRPKFNESELSASFINGTEIKLKGADNEESLLGVGLEGLVVDEFASIHNNWRVWNEILRPMLTDKKGWALFIGTPKGKDALFELFTRGVRGEHNYKSFQFHTKDNPFIDPQEVEDARKELPERYFRQEYEASFEDFQGLIYPEFNDNHVIKPYYVQSVFRRIGAIDPALSGTTACLKAYIDEEGDLVVYDEYYEKDKRVSEVSHSIKEENVQWYIDPAAAAKNVQNKEGKLYSLYDEYADYGIRAYTAENDVEAGINRVGEYFKQGRIKIFSSCKNLIWELQRYHWAEERENVRGQVKAEPYKKNDHLCDCLRYLIMSRPYKTDLRIDEPINPNSPFGRYVKAGGKPW